MAGSIAMRLQTAFWHGCAEPGVSDLASCARYHQHKRCSLDQESVADDKATRRVQQFLQTLPPNLCQQSFPTQWKPAQNPASAPAHVAASLTACRISHPCLPNTTLRFGPASQDTSLRNSLYTTPHKESRGRVARTFLFAECANWGM